jgi:uncharacterized iron-regulated membrane protein
MRPFLVRLHRYAGLAIALFLFVAGATGAIIAWDHELDGALNPGFFKARSGPGAPALAGLVLAERLEARDPRLQVTYAPLAVAPGEAWVARVAPRIDPATGRPFPLDFDQVALDPATGQVQGRRLWGRAALDRLHLLPFLYKLHYTLHLPGTWGVLFMGGVGLLWALDSFVALWISFPRRGAWRRSFTVGWRQGGARLLFDLHRSGGVWAWAGLLVLATTSVSMNLGNQVVRPLVGIFSPLTPAPPRTRVWATRGPCPGPGCWKPPSRRRSAGAGPAPPGPGTRPRRRPSWRWGSSRRARTTATEAWAIPGCTWTPAPARWPATTCPARAAGAMCSSRPSSPSTREGSWGCPEGSW